MKPSFLSIVFLFISSAAFSQVQLKQTGIVISAYFEKGKWEILDREQIEKQLIEAKSKYKKIALITKGYSDTIGSTQYNIYLTDFRLNAVREMTQLLKIETRSKEIIGESSEKPLEKNRRVDIYVLTPEDRIIKPEPLPEVVEESIPEPELNVPVQTNIEFEPGTHTIKNYSYREVDILFFVLSDHPDYLIELNGHVCCADDYNLSYQRALAVKNQLVRKGIDPERITVTGFSNSQPLVPETSDANKQRNRRVEAVYKTSE